VNEPNKTECHIITLGWIRLARDKYSVCAYVSEENESYEYDSRAQCCKTSYDSNLRMPVIS